jgi:predicted nucleic acid-binding Zn ribbon protein
MPIYPYKCPVGHVTELRTKIDERPNVVVCKEEGCNREAERSIAIPGKPKFEGHGWTPRRMERK